MAEEEAVELPVKGGNAKLMLVLGLVFGLALGGGGVVGYFLFLAPPTSDAALEAQRQAKAEKAAEKAIDKAAKRELIFIKLERLSVPLIASGGQLIGYVSMDMNFEVEDNQGAEIIRNEMPVLRHAINAGLAKTGAGFPDNPRMIDYEGTAARIKEIANQALPKPVVRAVKILSIIPL